MQTVIIVIHLLVVLAMIGLVLLQKSEGGGLVSGGGGGFMTSRSTTNVLSRTTAILAADTSRHEPHPVHPGGRRTGCGLDPQYRRAVRPRPGRRSRRSAEALVAC